LIRYAQHRPCWFLYYRYIRIYTVLCRRDKRFRDPEFRQRKLKTGRIGGASLQSLIDGIDRSPVIAFSSGDCAPGYRPNATAYSQQLVMIHLDERQKACLQRALEQLEPDVSRCLGTPWEIVNFRCFKMPPGLPREGAAAYHRDGFPGCIWKLFIYLTPVNADYGSTEFLFDDGSTFMLDGAPGTWLLFQNSALRHRAVIPEKYARCAIELTIAPSFRHNMTPLSAGMNAQYPYFPWYRRRMGPVSL
jgi:hypothetical protein